MQNNASVKSLPEQKITSFSPEACLYRWVNREIVDSMFAKRTAMVKDNTHLVKKGKSMTIMLVSIGDI